MQIERFQDTASSRWDEFVEQSANGTLMHQRRFLAYHPPERFVDHSVWILGDDSSVIAVFPAAEVVRDGRRLWVSHPGATYGGLIFQESASASVVDGIVGHVIDYARTQRFDGIRMRLSEGSVNTATRATLDAALFRHDFMLTARELSSVVALNERNTDDPYDGLSATKANSIRRALREQVVASESEDFASFWSLLETNLAERHGVKPTHTLAEIERLRTIFGERVQLVAAFSGDRMIAGTVVFYLNRRVAYTMYMAQNYEFNRLSPLNLVLFQTAIECRSRQIQFIIYGVSTEPGSDGRDVNWNLFQFKCHHGALAAVRDTWVKSLG